MSQMDMNFASFHSLTLLLMEHILTNDILCIKHMIHTSYMYMCVYIYIYINALNHMDQEESKIGLILNLLEQLNESDIDMSTGDNIQLPWISIQ